MEEASFQVAHSLPKDLLALLAVRAEKQQETSLEGPLRTGWVS
jgi:hypothetical protein